MERLTLPAVRSKDALHHQCKALLYASSTVSVTLIAVRRVAQIPLMHGDWHVQIQAQLELELH